MRVTKRLVLAAIALAVCLTCAPAANASIITFANRDAFDAAFPNASRENWDTFGAGTTFANGSTVNGITYNSSTNIAVVTSGFLNTTNPNGLGRTPINFFGAADSITFTFSQPLLAFGIDINTFATNTGAYTATTNLGDVANSFFNPFPGATTGQFVGFVSDTPFTSATIQGANTNLAYTLDSMRFVAVPESASLTLLGIGAVGALVGYRRRLQATAA